jgi:hypothetical protein
MRFLYSICLLASLGCGSTVLEEVSYPAFGRGATPAPFFVGEWEVALSVAEVGIGPVYFCATEGASADLCPTAVQEMTYTATLDALDPTPHQLGDVTGVTGTIRSMTYDFAITWFPTQTTPTPQRGAPDGHAARFEGRATRGATSFSFIADVDVLPPFQGTRAVQGARVRADVSSSQTRLDVKLDAARLFLGVDFDELSMTSGTPIAIGPGSRAHNALVFGLTGGATGPQFTWSTP